MKYFATIFIVTLVFESTLGSKRNDINSDTNKIKHLRQRRNLQTASILLEFPDTIGNAPVSGFYDGDGGDEFDFGISFSQTVFGVTNSDEPFDTRDFSNVPSPNTVMAIPDGGFGIMNVFPTFTTGLTFSHTSSFSGGTFGIYSEFNGVGSVLFTGIIQPTIPNGTIDQNEVLSTWATISVSFEGVAKSVVFVDISGAIFFDDILVGTFNDDERGLFQRLFDRFLNLFR